jgi:hypothetical protein
MRPIPFKMRQTLEAMPRMRMCEMAWYAGEFGICDGRVQWHHVWEYAGTQINEIWAILGVCTKHHDMVKTNRAVKELLELRSVEIATDEELAKYPKRAWKTMRKYLQVKTQKQ